MSPFGRRHDRMFVAFNARRFLGGIVDCQALVLGVCRGLDAYTFLSGVKHEAVMDDCIAGRFVELCQVVVCLE